MSKFEKAMSENCPMWDDNGRPGFTPSKDSQWLAGARWAYEWAVGDIHAKHININHALVEKNKELQSDYDKLLVRYCKLKAQQVNNTLRTYDGKLKCKQDE